MPGCWEGTSRKERISESHSTYASEQRRQCKIDVMTRREGHGWLEKTVVPTRTWLLQLKGLHGVLTPNIEQIAGTLSATPGGSSHMVS